MTTNRLAFATQKRQILVLSFLYFASTTAVSCARWANFEYQTFDLAYYVQALWQLIHGRFQVSVQGVPLLGNHVEPIVFLFAPLFLIIRHPLLFVVAQNLALASMGPVAFDIAQRLGFEKKQALLLAGAVLVTPAAGYLALHEFHPESLTAPFILLILRARLRNSIRAHWGWLVATLACKENMALLVIAYCAVSLVEERKRPVAELRAWYVWPMIVSLVWFVVCTKLITPLLNSGNIDYLALYDRLGASPGEILRNAITQPQRIIGALHQSLTQGNLVWGLLLPFLALPLVRLRWVLITAPILLQHLLSWRSSEWMIYFHYAAPILPFFWLAAVEGIASMKKRPFFPLRLRSALPVFLIVGCSVAQIFLGPAKAMARTIAGWGDGQENRVRKRAFVSQVPKHASVLAPLPYLSHLAMREKLYSLHYVLKGLKTLSRSTYEPPPTTDFVLIDYDDSATFDPIAGYYHPAMKTVDGRVIPSSERLLHQFLEKSTWTVSASDELTTFRQAKHQPTLPPSPAESETIAAMDGANLVGIKKSAKGLADKEIEITTNWIFENPRDVFPWMFLKFSSKDRQTETMITRGLCGPEVTSGHYLDHWRITPANLIPDGVYDLQVLFVNNSKRVWPGKGDRADLRSILLAPPVSLGELHVSGHSNPISQIKD